MFLKTEVWFEEGTLRITRLGKMDETFFTCQLQFFNKITGVISPSVFVPFIPSQQGLSLEEG